MILCGDQSLASCPLSSRQALLCSLGIAFMAFCAGGCGTTGGNGSPAEISRDLQYQARSVSFNEPAPAWQTPLFAAEVDELVPLDKSRALVGVLDLIGDFGSPVNGPYVLLDTATGQEVWQYERTKNRDNHYNFVYDGPALVVARARKDSLTYIGLDAQQGREIWHQSFDLPIKAAIHPQAGLLLVARVGGTQAEVVALRLTDGTILWKKNEAIQKGDPVPELMIWNDDIVSVGRSVACYATDGRLVWHSGEVGPVAPSTLPVVRSDGLYIPDASGTTTKISKEGISLWAAPLGGTVVQLNADGDLVFAQLEQLGGTSIVALDGHSGKRLWKEPVVGGIKSWLAIAGNRVAYVAGQKLEVRDRASGQQLFAVPCLTSSAQLFEHVLLYDKHAIVGSESGVQAFSLQTGQCLWDHRVRNDRKEFYVLSDAQIAYDVEISSKQKKGTTTPIRAQSMRADDSFMKWAVQNQERVAANPGASRQERINAASGVITAVRINSAMSSMQFSIDMFNWTLAMQSRAGSIVEAMAEGAEARRLGALLNLIPFYHLNAVHGDYYIRPFALHEDRYGLLVVDMRDGSWSEITTCPNDLLYAAWGMQTELHAVTGDGKLLVRGTGVDPARWKAYVRWNHLLPSPAVLAYDLRDLKFRDSGQFDQALQIKHTMLLETSPYYIRKGDRLVSLVDIEYPAYSTVTGKPVPAGAKLVATTDQGSPFDSLVNVKGIDPEENFNTSIFKIRKVDAPWPPTFAEGEQVILAMDFPIEARYRNNQSFFLAPQKGDVLTVLGIAGDGQTVSARDAKGLVWSAPFPCVVRLKPKGND